MKFNLIKRVPGILTLVFCAALASQAQTPESDAGANVSDTKSRIEQLETQVLALQTQLEALRLAVLAHGNVSQTGAQVEFIPANLQRTGPAPEASTASAKKPQPVDGKPQGVEVGPVTITPYGTIYLNAFSNSGASNNADVPLFAAPTGAKSVGASARQTRLGLKLEGPQVLSGKLRGVLEADFFGGFPTIGLGENFGLVRLRQAFARIDWESSSVEAGQDWVVFAPVNPASLSSAAIPLFAAAGNNWARMPQIRYEKRFFSSKLNWQSAVLAPATGDTTSTFLLQPNAGSTSRTPFMQSRLAFNEKNWFGLKKPGTIAVSGQYGRARTTPSAPKVDSVGVAVDWTMPLVPHVSLAGEAFTGRALAGFQSGVFQGFNTDFVYRNGTSVVNGGPRSISSRGGWVQVGFTPPHQEKLTFYGALGIDDPKNLDLRSRTNINFRARNQAYAFSLIQKLSQQFSWSIEFRRLETNYTQTTKASDNHVNLGIAFSF